MDKTSPVEAVVMSVNGLGRNKYVVSKITSVLPPKSALPTEATVTFSISEYEGDHVPRPGQIVLLSDIEKFAKGWRARSVKPVRAQ